LLADGGFADPSGPKISVMRPRGTPPTPSATSSAGAGGHSLDVEVGSIPQPHQRPVAKAALDLRHA
jgi:hypothetical protein